MESSDFEDDGDREGEELRCDYCGAFGHLEKDCRKNCSCEEYPGQHRGSCY